MARRKPDPRIETDPTAGGLTHNPFAALRPGGATGGGSPAEPGTRPGDADSADEAPSSPAGGRVVVRRERKGRGGKGVTLAEGPGLADQDRAALARAAARALGTGARVEGEALCVQGECAERLQRFLEERGLGPVILGN